MRKNVSSIQDVVLIGFSRTGPAADPRRCGQMVRRQTVSCSARAHACTHAHLHRLHDGEREAVKEHRHRERKKARNEANEKGRSCFLASRWSVGVVDRFRGRAAGLGPTNGSMTSTSISALASIGAGIASIRRIGSTR